MNGRTFSHNLLVLLTTLISVLFIMFAYLASEVGRFEGTFFSFLASFTFSVLALGCHLRKRMLYGATIFVSSLFFVYQAYAFFLLFSIPDSFLLFLLRLIMLFSLALVFRLAAIFYKKK